MAPATSDVLFPDPFVVRHRLARTRIEVRYLSKLLKLAKAARLALPPTGPDEATPSPVSLTSATRGCACA